MIFFSTSTTFILEIIYYKRNKNSIILTFWCVISFARYGFFSCKTHDDDDAPQS